MKAWKWMEKKRSDEWAESSESEIKCFIHYEYIWIILYRGAFTSGKALLHSCCHL